MYYQKELDNFSLQIPKNKDKPFWLKGFELYAHFSHAEEP